MYKVDVISSFIIAAASLLSLQGCTTLFYTGPVAEVKVDKNMVITDLSSNERLRVYQDGPDSYVTRFRNGKRYALRVQKDSITTYAFLEPHRNPWVVLNYFTACVGFIVDHATKSFYTYDEEYLLARTEDAVPKADQAHIEDSLRKRVTPVVPTGLIYERDYGVVSLWISPGFEGPTTQAVLGPPTGAVGIGVNIVPWVMPLYERGYISYIETGDLYDTKGTFEAFGVALQEPVLGVYAAWKYAKGKIDGFSYNQVLGPPDYPERQVYRAALEFYTLSVGIYGQWGRLEYRHRRNTAWTSPPEAPNLSGSYNGLHFYMHIML